MTDVDSYITDEAVAAASDAYAAGWRSRMDNPHEGMASALRAVLPRILARHRADVLREAAGRRADFCSRSPMCLLADEAVAE